MKGDYIKDYKITICCYLDGHVPMHACMCTYAHVTYDHVMCISMWI